MARSLVVSTACGFITSALRCKAQLLSSVPCRRTRFRSPNRSPLVPSLRRFRYDAVWEDEMLEAGFSFLEEAGRSALPLFHLYGDPPDDSVFDFIHIETIASRSAVHDWTIRAHRHRNLFQILLIEK